MKTNPGLEKTAAYVHAHQFADATANGANSTAGPFVTISREAGAGASTLARFLQQRLEASSGGAWTVFDGNLITEMLQANQLPSNLARFLPESRVSEIEATIGEIVGLHPNLWALAQKTDDFIRRLARLGRVIFVGRGAKFATAGLANGIHIRLVAPADYRAQVMAKRHNVSIAEAIEYNRRQDQTRRDYVHTHFSAVGPDPLNYDLVINTSRVSLDCAAETVVGLVRTRAALAA